jgi:hypothetical protein
MSEVCFVIAPIGEDSSDTRARSDRVFKHIISPAVSNCGFEPVRADQISEPGVITSQIIQRLIDEPLVIADLSEHNPNVFYELAIRHAIRKPVIQIIHKSWRIPFDVHANRTVQYDDKDLDSVEDAKLEISAQIKHAREHPSEVASPVSIAVDIASLHQSDNPVARSLADILAAIQDLRAEVVSSEKDRTVEALAFERQRRAIRERNLTRSAERPVTRVEREQALRRRLKSLEALMDDTREGAQEPADAARSRLDDLELEHARVVEELARYASGRAGE